LAFKAAYSDKILWQAKNKRILKKYNILLEKSETLIILNI
tara:strand:- start:2163 stop:2282 length:120 start_codon:yes stop_codon:yes gene_type:complete